MSRRPCSPNTAADNDNDNDNGALSALRAFDNDDASPSGDNNASIGTGGGVPASAHRDKRRQLGLAAPTDELAEVDRSAVRENDRHEEHAAHAPATAAARVSDPAPSGSSSSSTASNGSPASGVPQQRALCPVPASNAPLGSTRSASSSSSSSSSLPVSATSFTPSSSSSSAPLGGLAASNCAATALLHSGQYITDDELLAWLGC